MNAALFRDASCRTTDPDVMHPEVGGAGLRDARRVCARCPFEVWSACLLDALDRPAKDVGGVWASTSPRERSDLRKQRAAGSLPPLTKLHHQLATVR